ncbi:MAG: NTP transferase domain-containing protein [Bacteroidetes bacterium]|nr:NTP transferase domain-containing protein [Bacteroidota bacterium]HET6244840.1 nucleotidyltransferase family protein [Bacteroidia bacterium]
MIKEAIILAGGLGTRLQSVVSDVPKPMAPVNGKPFLEYLVRYLLKFGIQKIIFSVGYKSEAIVEYFGTYFENITIVYAKEEEPLGTGGGLKKAIEKCTTENVLILNGDTFLELDLNEFYNFHQLENADISLCLRNMINTSRYGTVKINDQKRVIAFQEKTGENTQGLINGGVYIFRRKKFNAFDLPEKFSLEKDFFEPNLKNLTIIGYTGSGYFIDIGIPEDYQKAQIDFKGFE